MNQNQHLIRDMDAKNLTYQFIKNSYSIVDKELIESLVSNTKKLKKTIRISLHNSNKDDLHSMIIAHPFSTYSRPHANPNNSKVYHHIQGKMLMVGFDENQKELFRTILSDENKILRIEKGVYLYLEILSEISVFHEIAIGPYIKGESTIYPNWAPLKEDYISRRIFKEEYIDGK